jgi:ABC-2 type transport system permease protein
LYKLLPLIQNENMKIYRRLRTWILIGLVVVINLIMAIVLNTVDSSPISHTLDFVSISTELAFFVVIFTVIIAGDIVASEYSWGTIKLLLIRPVSRTKILLSKYIATLIFALVLILTVVLCSFSFGFLFFGTSGDSEIKIIEILKNYGFSSIDAVMTITFAFMISTVFRSSALAIALSFILLFIGGSITGVLSQFNYNWGKYLLFANTDLRQFFEPREPYFEGVTLGFAVSMILIYFMIFHLISWYIFKKRDVSL